MIESLILNDLPMKRAYWSFREAQPFFSFLFTVHMFSSKYVRFSTIGVYRHRLLITLIQLETHVHLYTPETENDEEEEPKMSVVAASSTWVMNLRYYTLSYLDPFSLLAVIVVTAFCADYCKYPSFFLHSGKSGFHVVCFQWLPRLKNFLNAILFQNLLSV